jgi:hypothetical protein
MAAWFAHLKMTTGSSPKTRLARDLRFTGNYCTNPRFHPSTALPAALKLVQPVAGRCLFVAFLGLASGLLSAAVDE